MNKVIARRQSSIVFAFTIASCLVLLLFFSLDLSQSTAIRKTHSSGPKVAGVQLYKRQLDRIAKRKCFGECFKKDRKKIEGKLTQLELLKESDALRNEIAKYLCSSCLFNRYYGSGQKLTKKGSSCSVA